MLKQNPLQKLYPNLKLNRIPLERNDRSQSPISRIPEPERPKSPPKMEIPTVEKIDEPIPPPLSKEVKIIESPKIPEPIPVVEIPQEPKEEIKELESPIRDSQDLDENEVNRPKALRPNRLPTAVKPEPVRESQIPKKGERGLRPKYTQEQRKDMYLERLSRKSVKNAEKEISKVNEVLDRNDHQPTNLLKEEREVKQHLKLINQAKLFVNDPIDQV